VKEMEDPSFYYLKDDFHQSSIVKQATQMYIPTILVEIMDMLLYICRCIQNRGTLSNLNEYIPKLSQ
jgi:hypothetical protein